MKGNNRHVCNTDILRAIDLNFISSEKFMISGNVRHALRWLSTTPVFSLGNIEQVPTVSVQR
jgi:hypothetical protein